MLTSTRASVLIIIRKFRRSPLQTTFPWYTINRRCLTLTLYHHQPRSPSQNIIFQPETTHHEEEDDHFSYVEGGTSLSPIGKSTTVDDAKKAILENFNPVTAAVTISKLKKVANKKDISAVVDDVSSTLLRNKEFDNAMDLIKELVKNSIVPILPYTYTRLLRELYNRKKGSRGSGVVKPFLSLVQFMDEHGYKSNASHQFQILRMAARSGDSQLAQTCFDGLKSSPGFQIDVRDYGLLVEAYMKNSRKKNNWDNEIVIHYFNELLDKGHQLKERQIKMFLMNSVFSDTFNEIRDVIGKLRKESDVTKYCQYHDHMLLVYSHLLRNDIVGAKELARKSEYPQDSEQLIGLFTHSRKKKEGDAP